MQNNSSLDISNSEFIISAIGGPASGGHNLEFDIYPHPPPVNPSKSRVAGHSGSSPLPNDETREALLRDPEVIPQWVGSFGKRHKEHKGIIPVPLVIPAQAGIQSIFHILHTKTATPPLAEQGGII
ncbi:MAG: hypothetical protein QME51_07805 [Planctomycetota bacterium]|nr:hypothetical protein [Planctomycetota bacterium]